MNQLVKDNRPFLIPWCLIVMISIVVMAVIPRIELHLLLNGYHSPALDLFFKGVTHVGGNLPWVVCAVMLVVKMWKGAMLTVAQVIATILVQPIKHLLHHPRPLIVFTEANVDFPIVDGVSLHSWNSFPSGHTAAVFALLFGFAILMPKWWQKVICLLLALITGYSRIYLSQHFLDDVVAGSVVGVVSVFLAMLFFKNQKDNGNKTQEIQ